MNEKPKSRKSDKLRNMSGTILKGDKSGFCGCFNIMQRLAYDELEDCLHSLQQRCLTHRLDSYRIHIDRKKGCKLLYQMINHSQLIDYSITHIIGIIWCSLSIYHHFHIRIKLEGRAFRVWTRKRDSDFALKCFNKLMIMVLPSFLITVLQSIITFFNEAKLWDLELYCFNIFKKVLDHANDTISVINALLGMVFRKVHTRPDSVFSVRNQFSDVVELSSIDIARKVLRVLYGILENLDWPQIDEQLIMRFLNLYKTCIGSISGGEMKQLRKGVEVCLRYLYSNIRKNDLIIAMRVMMQWTFRRDITDEMLLEFGPLLEYASTLHDKAVYKYAITDDLLPLLLDMMSSKNLLHNMLGNRMLQHMLDRHNNAHMFRTPRIFFQQSQYNIEMEEYCSEDKNFIKDYREALHMTLLASIQLHGKYRVIVENTYTTLALLLVEVPCGYTATAVVCLMMAIQEVCLTNERLNLDSTHRIHAIVIALISLVCWIHRAEVFYEYVNTILTRRAEIAPFLNPPLQSTYKYALHHVIWNKPELFFEDWESRFGLWKCFKNKIVIVEQTEDEEPAL